MTSVVVVVVVVVVVAAAAAAASTTTGIVSLISFKHYRHSGDRSPTSVTVAAKTTAASQVLFLGLRCWQICACMSK